MLGIESLIKLNVTRDLYIVCTLIYGLSSNYRDAINVKLINPNHKDVQTV